MAPFSTEGLLSPWTPGVFSLSLYAAIVFALVGLLLFLSAWLGDRRPNPEKLRPYESGIIPTGSARLRYPVPFYLIAIFLSDFRCGRGLHLCVGRGRPKTWAGRAGCRCLFLSWSC